MDQGQVSDPAENVGVAPDAKADGQQLCGNANGLPANVCRTVLDQHDVDWHHNVLRSAQGTEIHLDHKPHFLKYRDEWTVGTSTYRQDAAAWTGQPLWFNVSSSAFTGGERVHAVFIVKRNGDCSGPQDCGYFQIDFTYAGNGRFTSLWQDGNPFNLKQQFVRSDGAVEYSTYTYEIAVSVDDRWQDDPVSGSHNFHFDLTDGLGF
jgi:hypothetical protein